MTEEEAIKQLDNQSGDTELDHINAESVILSFLRCRGYKDLADKYSEVSEDFWYA